MQGAGKNIVYVCTFFRSSLVLKHASYHWLRFLFSSLLKNTAQGYFTWILDETAQFTKYYYSAVRLK